MILHYDINILYPHATVDSFSLLVESFSKPQKCERNVRLTSLSIIGSLSWAETLFEGRP